ncbi:recombination-associated protein RdgC [bacterium]|nr:recombination-associated protein RdgC [bacterium]
MSLISGAISARVYRVEEPPARDALHELGKDLKRYAFQPVRVDRSPRSMGWVSPRNLLDTDLAIEKVLFEDFVVLGLRLDKVTVNAKLLKAYYQQAVQKLLKDQQRKQLSRDERAALMERTKIDLMAQQSPTTSLYEMAWNLTSHHVYFSATSTALNTEFADLFQETFHTGLTPLFPYLRAEPKAQKEGLAEALMQLEPSILSPLGRVDRD